jgi:crotonobetainyl-CoA:carnitine CoA-transferase CaiB-like acyl-CoA transferase
MSILSDIRVVELASVLAGPNVGMFLAEQGAQVVKVENKTTGGDVTRFWRLPGEDVKGLSAYFCAVNAGKTHIFLDLMDPTDRKVLDGHIGQADVLILNFKPGDAEKFELTTNHLKKRYPKLIIATLQGFEGASNRVAYDVVIQAETGYMSMNGTQASGPLKMPVAMMDLLAAHQLRQGILLALYNRQKTGKGALVQHSLEAAGVSNLANQASNYLMAGHVATRMGSLHPNIAPYGDTFICKDGKPIVLAVGSNGQFQKLCQVLGAPDLASDSLFSTNANRVDNRSRLVEALAPLFRQKSAFDWISAFHQQHIPAGQVKDVSEVLGQPHLAHLIWRTDENGQEAARVRTSGFEIFCND